MDFEWDEDKRAEVIRLRGVDFLVAALVFDDPARTDEPDERKDYGERRYKTAGWVGPNRLMVVYTMRGAVCRIITAWRTGSR